MRAAVYHSAGDVRVEDVPDAALQAPTDAVVRVVRSCVCGSDLWSYRGVISRAEGARLGHEFIGIVEEIGSEVSILKVGDFVVAPFQWSDNTCPACRDGIHTSCVNGGGFGAPGTDGGQGEAVRVPQADGTLVVVPGGLAGLDPDLLPSLLALTDVAATGLHGAALASVAAGSTVAVIGDGAVGLSAVLGATAILGAERVILLSSHEDRAALGRSFGATDIVTGRGEAAKEEVLALTDGLGVRHVVEAVGTESSWATALDIARPGGTIGAVGVPHESPQLPLFPLLRKNLTVGVGLAPVRKYLPDLIERVLRGGYEPGRVFDLALPLEETAEGYAAMSDRRSIKTMLVPS